MPIAVRLALALVRAASWLVPARERDAWRREWRAEVLQGGSTGLPLLQRAAGAFPDAGWLRRHAAPVPRTPADAQAPRSGLPMWRLPHDWAWAVRGVRARGWRAAVVALILAAALAANTLLFAVADSLVFRPLPYRDPGRLITLKAVSTDGSPAQAASLRPPQVLDDLRARRDLFATVHAYMRGSYTFVMDEVTAAREPTAFVTPGLFEMLGWAPALGRTFTDADVTALSPRVAVVAESLAAERFGQSRLAVGQTIATSEDRLLIVGVMPKGFQFPDGAVRVWRPLDHPHATNGAVYAIGRLAPGVGSTQASAGLAGLGAQLAAGRGIPTGATLVTAPLDGANASAPALLLLLIGAAACLLVIACANAASVEIAGATARARAFAIQVSLGATRASLVRTSALEGAFIVGGAVAMAAAMATLAEETLSASLPSSMMRFVANPVDLDARALAFMAGLSGLVWLAASLPVAIHASRPNVLAVLQAAGHAVSPAGARVRRALTVVQVALAVLLLVGGILYTRTYAALLGVDKGFESTPVVTINLTLPTTIYSAPGATRVLADQVLATLGRRPDVESFARLPNVLDEGTTTDTVIEVDDEPGQAGSMRIAMRSADAAFFETMRVPVLRGRGFEPGEPETNVLITPELAERLWPGRDPVGRLFRLVPTQPWRMVVGLVRHVRYPGERPDTDRPGRAFEIYAPPPPPPPPPVSAAAAAAATPLPAQPLAATVAAPRPNVPGPVAFMFLSFAARVSPGSSLAELEADLRRIGTRFGLRVQRIDQAYAEAHQDRLLAARTVGSFAALSFLLSIAGVYGVIALLVASRRREIGIRTALGADGRRIRAHVLRSAARLVALGALLGIAAAMAIGTVVRSQLYGVEPTDPVTYAVVVAIVAGAALLASLIPALEASRIDPVRALRAE